jgi:hypothetical protein
MSIQEADDCAALIVELFGVTCRSLLSTARASAEVVQLHGAERESADFEAPSLIASN